MSEIKRLRILLRAVYRGPAWHGPAIREVLDGVTVATALAHPVPDTHSIWQTVLHMTYWRRIVTAALEGGPVDEHPPAELNWPSIEDDSPAAWEKALASLEESQRLLVERLKVFPEGRLAENVGDRAYSYYFMLHGIVQHDIYHAGQIALLKKAAG